MSEKPIEEKQVVNMEPSGSVSALPNESVKGEPSTANPTAEPVPSSVDEDTVDPAVVMLALSVGSEILQYIADGNIDGLRGFVDAVVKEVNKQRNLMRLLEMESDDLDRLLSSLSNEGGERVQESSPSPAPSVAEVNPAVVLVSPADRMGRGEKGGSRSLWELVRGG